MNDGLVNRVVDIVVLVHVVVSLVTVSEVVEWLPWVNKERVGLTAE